MLTFYVSLILLLTMATLLFNYSDILFPHVVARFPQYDIINDFKKINIKLKTVIILENNLTSSATIGFMKGFLKKCQNIVVIIKSQSLPNELFQIKKYFSTIDNCINYQNWTNCKLFEVWSYFTCPFSRIEELK